MNREIKFRVWDKQTKQWFPIENAMGLVLNPKSTDLVFMTQSGPYKIPETNQEDGGINRFILQQYIGVNDKNDKLIYEGDIVKFNYNTYEHEVQIEIGEVYFEDGIFMFGRDLGFATNDCNFNTKSLEVIGNILENPELIKKDI